MFRDTIFLSLLMVTANIAAEELTFESGIEQIELIELFTSEGCSSCPPADRWLSGLKRSASLWSEFVPVAFHVDYWDYIGWSDRFATREYSQRQRRYAAEFQEPTVYTPGLRKAGHEWRRWRQTEPAVMTRDKVTEVGELTVSVNEAREFAAKFTPIKLQRGEPFQLTVALLGMGLSTKVQRGENRGKKLKHDFVVLGLTTLSGRKLDLKQGQLGMQWQGTLPDHNEEGAEYALAAWVSQGASQVPIQAVGGLLEN